MSVQVSLFRALVFLRVLRQMVCRILLQLFPYFGVWSYVPKRPRRAECVLINGSEERMRTAGESCGNRRMDYPHKEKQQRLDGRAVFSEKIPKGLNQTRLKLLRCSVRLSVRPAGCRRLKPNFFGFLNLNHVAVMHGQCDFSVAQAFNVVFHGFNPTAVLRAAV